MGDEISEGESVCVRMCVCVRMGISTAIHVVIFPCQKWGSEVGSRIRVLRCLIATFPLFLQSKIDASAKDVQERMDTEKSEREEGISKSEEETKKSMDALETKLRDQENKVILSFLSFVYNDKRPSDCSREDLVIPVLFFFRRKKPQNQDLRTKQRICCGHSCVGVSDNKSASEVKTEGDSVISVPLYMMRRKPQQKEEEVIETLLHVLNIFTFQNHDVEEKAIQELLHL